MVQTLIRTRWFIAIVAAQVAIFVFDMTTHEDDVSVGFLYTVPTLLGFFLKERTLQVVVTVISSALIVFGCFFPPPLGDDLLVFVTNRVLSILTVIITGGMVNYRCRLEQTLNAALAKEKQDSAMQRAFVSMVSHEFRTPLTIIDGEAYRLIKLRNGISAEDLETRARSIRDGVSRMVMLIDNVLYASRAYDNKITLNLDRVNLRMLLKSACIEHAHMTAFHHIDCEVGDLPVFLRADKDLLRYVFDNLIGNAVKYSPEDTTITVSGQAEDGWAVVRVKDHGIGIPAADLPRLFEPYYRGGNVASVSGSGIGLYIVDTFVRLHGGRVEVKSVEGQGAEFSVFLPMAGGEG